MSTQLLRLSARQPANCTLLSFSFSVFPFFGLLRLYLFFLALSSPSPLAASAIWPAFFFIVDVLLTCFFLLAPSPFPHRQHHGHPAVGSRHSECCGGCSLTLACCCRFYCRRKLNKINYRLHTHTLTHRHGQACSHTDTHAQRGSYKFCCRCYCSRSLLTHCLSMAVARVDSRACA